MNKEGFKCPKCNSSKVVRKTTVSARHNKPLKKMLCNNCRHVFYINNPDIKRIIFLHDWHCGHITGLTPPSFQTIHQNPNDKQKKIQDFRKDSWIWFKNQLELHKPFDIMIAPGDLIDGRQEKSGGSELIEASRIKQCDMAIEVIETVNAKQRYIARGTAYHTGRLEEWENIIADKTNSYIDNILRLDVNGCNIYSRHHIGRAASPHGRYTPLARMGLWEDLKIAGTKEEKVNIMAFGHVHYVAYMGHGNRRLIFTGPALQGASNFGELRCEGITDYGFTIIDIYKDGSFSHPTFVTRKVENENKYMKV